MGGELGEEIELRRSEVDVLSRAAHAARREVDHEIMGLDDAGAGRARCRTAEHALDPRDALARRERQRVSNERTDIRLVVDDEDLHVASGRDVTTAAPPPGFSSYSSVPPWRVTRERAIASPRPEPGVPLALFPRKNFSKMRCRSSEAIPGPWSRTSIRSASPRRCAATRMGVP